MVVRVVKVLRSQSTFLRLLHKLVVDVAVVLEVLVLLQVFSLELVPGPELELELLLVDWATSISYETTLNSSNSDRSSNKTLRCLSLSFNKLVQVIHNWHN